jgi:hypothetical protein
MRDELWKDGKLCFWRDNPFYSKKTKMELEKRTIEMLKNVKK